MSDLKKTQAKVCNVHHRFQPSPENFQWVCHERRGIRKLHILQVCGNYRIICDRWRDSRPNQEQSVYQHVYFTRVSHLGEKFQVSRWVITQGKLGLCWHYLKMYSLARKRALDSLTGNFYSNPQNTHPMATTWERPACLCFMALVSLEKKSTLVE